MDSLSLTNDPPVKQRLWSASGKSLYTCTIAASNIGLPFGSDLTDQQYEDVLQEVIRMKHRKDRAITEYKLAPVPQIQATQHDWKARYQAAHRAYYEIEFTQVCKSGFYVGPVLPKVHTANGLQSFIVNYLDWTGCYGNRINTTGRKIFSKKQNKEIWITGTTKNGTGDTVACLKGKMIWFEVKIGSDTPKDKQIEQQRKIMRSGGKYYFVKNTDEFLTLYDAEMNS